jgi:hypothetical protein
MAESSISEKNSSLITNDICGVGLVLTNSSVGANTVKIAAICPGSPAACSGRIAVSDEIVQVEGRSTEGLQASEVAELLKGAKRTMLNMTLKKSTPFNSIFTVLLVRDRIGERDLSRLHIHENGTLGVFATCSDHVDGCHKSNAWTVVEIDEGGSVWLAHASSKTGFGKNFQATLQVGDQIEAVNSTDVAHIGATSAALKGKAFTRILLDVDRSGRKLLIDLVLTPKLAGESLMVAISRMELMFSAISRVEMGLASGLLNCSDFQASILMKTDQISASSIGYDQIDRNDEPPQEDVVELGRRKSSICSDGWLENSAFNEDFGSPRSFDSPRSADSLDDVILSLSQSVSSSHISKMCPDPKNDIA